MCIRAVGPDALLQFEPFGFEIPVLRKQPPGVISTQHTLRVVAPQGQHIAGLSSIPVGDEQAMQGRAVRTVRPVDGRDGGFNVPQNVGGPAALHDIGRLRGCPAGLGGVDQDRQRGHDALVIGLVQWRISRTGLLREQGRRCSEHGCEGRNEPEKPGHFESFVRDQTDGVASSVSDMSIVCAPRPVERAAGRGNLTVGVPTPDGA